MNFDQILGNRDAVKALEGMAASGRIPHAMMLYENDGCGAIALVLAFLGKVMQDEHKVSGLIHPDVHYVYPVANGSKVNEKVENLRAELFLKYWRELIVANPYALEPEVSTAFGVEGKQTGINNAELLNACHIVGWSEDEANRTNPQNGLCLNVLFHKAYDENLIGISPDYEIFVSEEFFGTKLKEVDSHTKEYVMSYNKRKLIMPKRFFPDRDLLAMHFEYFKSKYV